MTRQFTFALLLLTIAIGCRRAGEVPPMSLDTLRPAGDTNFKPKDTTRANADTSHSNLPPMAKAVDPDRLASFLPKLPGWTPVGELEKEIQIRTNFNRSRAAQAYTMGQKKLKVQIDDFAYVSYLYDPWEKFKGTYLDDDNVMRTETTTIAGYRAVQSMEKHDPHGEVTAFPGNRYVVTIVEDGADNINEVRHFAEMMDLHGLEAMQ